MLRLALASMLVLIGCTDGDPGDFFAGMAENAARSACRSASNCESRCANGAVTEHSDAICVVSR